MAENDDDSVRKVFELDQGHAAVTEFAQYVATFYNTLRKDDVPRGEALKMTLQLIATLAK